MVQVIASQLNHSLVINHVNVTYATSKFFSYSFWLDLNFYVFDYGLQFMGYLESRCIIFKVLYTMMWSISIAQDFLPHLIKILTLLKEWLWMNTLHFARYQYVFVWRELVTKVQGKGNNL